MQVHFIHSSDKHLSKACYVLGSILGGRDTAVEKIDKPTCLCRMYILVVGGRDGNLTDTVCQVVVSALERNRAGERGGGW